MNEPQTDMVLTDQRLTDRRSTSWTTIHGTLFMNRRRVSRRDGDHLDNYIDWYGHLPLIATVSIIALCFTDAFLTTILIGRGAVELNLLMDWLIQQDIYMFTVVKMAVTGVALIVLVMHFNFRIYRFIAVRYVLYALVPVYSVLIYHELTMLASI
ncbi:MAG: DUF5658 family protein [Gammaproteobacteria bacterium]